MIISLNNLKECFYLTSSGMSNTMRGSRGGDSGSGPPPPHEKSQNIGFLSNTGPDPLKITKLPSQHSMLGHHRHAIVTPLNGVSLAGR